MAIATRDPADLLEESELPVVARLVVEVRSDGRRTVARGLIEDLESGERTAVEASADSPLALVASLMRNLGGFARLAKRTVRALAPRREP